MHSGLSIALGVLVLVVIVGLDFAAILSVWRRWGGRHKTLTARLNAIALQRQGQGAGSGARPGGELARVAAHEGWIVRLARRTPMLERLQTLLMRAGSAQPAEHVLNLLVLAALGTGLLFGLISKSVLLALVMAALGVVFPLLWFSLRASRRLALFTEQLPEALDFMSRALRAGHSLSVAIGMVADELPDPIRGEFATVFDEVNFGISFTDALSKMPDRIDSSDLNFFVVAVLIQRETGGNLSDLLHSLAQTIRERLKLKGRVRVLSSEGRYSGILLGILPFLMAGALSVINPKYMSLLWDTETGNRLVTGAGFAMVIGFVWMWKLTRIKV